MGLKLGRADLVSLGTSAWQGDTSFHHSHGIGPAFLANPQAPGGGTLVGRVIPAIKTDNHYGASGLENHMARLAGAWGGSHSSSDPGRELKPLVDEGQSGTNACRSGEGVLNLNFKFIGNH